MASSEQQSSFL